MTSSDTSIDYKVSLFLHLHNVFLYNSLGFKCICHYFLVGTNVSLKCRHRLVVHKWDGDPSWSVPQTCGKDFKDAPWPPS